MSILLSVATQDRLNLYYNQKVYNFITKFFDTRVRREGRSCRKSHLPSSNLIPQARYNQAP